MASSSSRPAVACTFCRTSGPLRFQLRLRPNFQNVPISLAFVNALLAAHCAATTSGRTSREEIRSMLHAANTFVTLFAFWLLLSGYFTPFLIAAGAASALAVVAFSRRLDILDREGHPHHLLQRAVFSYWPWLAKEIVKSAWDVTRRVVDPRLPISPAMVRFAPSQQSELGLVIHANSITLTPGTISVEVAPGEFLVHALTAAGGASLAGSEMDRRVTRLERPR